MPWNEQRGGGGGGGWPGGRGPWGQGPSGGNRGGGGGIQPPNLEELMKRGQDRLRGMFPNQSPSVILIALIGGTILLLWILTGVYLIQQHERGVVLRFGKFVEVLESGLHVRLPQPIETVLRPDMRRQQINIGFDISPDNPTVASNVPRESLMLTGDENIVDIDFTVFWRVRDAVEFQFNVANVEDTIRAVAESAMRDAVGQAKAEPLLTGGRAELAEKVRTIMQSALDSYKAGVTVESVNVQQVDPPGDVLAAFRDVQAAKADQVRKQNDARKYANTVIPKARGEAAKIVQDAEAFKAQQIAEATGEARRFLSVYEQYRGAKEVTRQRMYLETMQRILSSTNKIILQHGGTAPPVILPYLPLLRGAQGIQVSPSPSGGAQ
jgi:membrane protease subunit HflK